MAGTLIDAVQGRMEGVAPVVAIVDDDEAVRRALSRLLQSLSFEPVAFASGEDFLVALPRIMACCALVDLHMPRMNGVGVILHMKAQMTNVPVVIITGNDQPEMRQKCLEAGAVDYRLKPLDCAAVLDAVTEAAAGSKNP